MIVLGDGELGYPGNRGTHDMNLDRRTSEWRHQWWIMTTCNAVEVQMHRPHTRMRTTEFITAKKTSQDQSSQNTDPCSSRSMSRLLGRQTYCG